MGGYSANVGFSVALLQQNGSVWSFVQQPDDGTCFAESTSAPPCTGTTYSWPISPGQLSAMVAQAGMTVDSYGDVEAPPGWTPPT